MWFIGKYDTGKSVANLKSRQERIAKEKSDLAVDVLKAIDARNAVIATIGEEVVELKSLNVF